MKQTQQQTETDLRKIIAVGTEQVSGLRDTLQRLGGESRRIRAVMGGMPEPKRRSTARAEYDRQQAELSTQLETVEASAATAQERFNATSEVLAEAVQRLAQIEGAADIGRRKNCAAVVETASKTAPSRLSFLEARAKLIKLRSQLVEIEKEQACARHGASVNESTEGRAAQLLETGTLPPATDATAASKALQSNRLATIKAIEMQTKEVDRIQAQYGSEVAAALRVPLRDIVARIATGLEMARAATAESRYLQTVFAEACGGHDESLPPHRYAGLPTPSGEQDQFTFWRDRMFVAGLLG